jgi:hypothetical protein
MACALRPQHNVIHDLFVRCAFGALKNAVEDGRLHHLAFGEGNADRLQIIGEGVKLFLAGFFVNAIDQRLSRLLERFRGRDIGHDHEFLD